MLKIDIRGIEMELTDAIVGAVEKKLGTLDKYLESIGTPKMLKVNVGKTTDHHNNGQIFKAEAILTIPAHEIHADVVSHELYAAVDLLKDDLKRQLLKVVKTTIDKHRDGARLAKEQGTETELV